MKSLEYIKTVVAQFKVKPGAEMRSKVLDEALRIQRDRQSSSDTYIWRIIMKSPHTKIATAAVIIIACFTGLHFWNSTGSGIALADVLTRLEQVTAYMYQMSTTTTGQDKNATATRTILVSKDHGVKTIKKVIDPDTGKITCHDMYWLPEENSVTVIRINHDKKTYISMKYEGTPSDNPKEEYNDPRTIIKNFLSCKHTSLGQSIVDGITVEGFQTTDLAYKRDFSDQAHQYMTQPEKVNAKIWVDLNTFLPVRTDEEIVRKLRIQGKDETHSQNRHDICYDFRWNVVLDASDFKPYIPDDYSNPTGDITIAPFTEESALKGLRLFADLTKNYPPTNKTKLNEQTRKLIGYGEDLPEDEKNRRNNDILKPIVGFEVFYHILVTENKEPVYYGDTVKPDDVDKVLLRWKLDDGQYRVVFGDLSAKTVTAEELAELEKE